MTGRKPRPVPACLPERSPASAAGPMAKSGASSLGRPLTFTAACICRATGRPGRCLSFDLAVVTGRDPKAIRYPPYLHRPVTASVHFRGFTAIVTVVWGWLSLLPVPDSCRVLRAGGRVRGREAPAQRRRRRRRRPRASLLVAAIFRIKRLLRERCSATCPRRRRPGHVRRRQDGCR